MTKKILLTGACGFIGHHFVEHFLKNTDWEIIIFDKLSYAASGLDRVKDIKAFDNKRVRFFSIDLTRPISEGIIKECKKTNYILHLAAESHVDKSIQDPLTFVYANVIGTANILEFARKCDNLEIFHYMGTDEVYGPTTMLKSTENYDCYNLELYHEYREFDRYNSTNPYSATKAGAEQLVLAYMNTYKIPGFVTNTMNNFGERQHSEKFIPLCIQKILNNKKIQIHGTPDKKESGSRFYIHARNTANAVHWLMKNFKQRDKYNITGEKELTNLELAQKISNIIGKPLKYEIMNFHESRPGHDLRYGLDDTKLTNMGYTIPVTIEESLKKTVEWTLNNKKWLKI